jgi:hypothetical protein
VEAVVPLTPLVLLEVEAVVVAEVPRHLQNQVAGVEEEVFRHYTHLAVAVVAASSSYLHGVAQGSLAAYVVEVAFHSQEDLHTHHHTYQKEVDHPSHHCLALGSHHPRPCEDAAAVA